jgi:hypothetical protein
LVNDAEINIILAAANMVLDDPMLVDKLAEELHLDPEAIASVGSRFADMGMEIVEAVQEMSADKSLEGFDLDRPI